MTRYILCAVLAMSMANLFVWAETDDEDYARIARISYMEGYVSFQGVSDVDWSAATVNLPLQPGDRIYTGPQGRAEIEFDEGSVFRLAEKTDIQFLSLKEDVIQIRILMGLSSLTVQSEVEFEIDTAAAAFVVLREGLYRFDTRESGDTDAIVRKGALDAVSHRFVRRVESGEMITVTADENGYYDLARYTKRDAWDEWNDRRDADKIARESREYVPDIVHVGVADLDRHGRWVTVEHYGVAWVPLSVGVSWSPYSVGRWCYRPSWGWTWVSYESWGWLPYHYGRWHRSSRYGWCWLPGPSFSFNFWSPGLVSFYYGPSWVSWCPLGPGDYYSINNYYFNRRAHRHLVVRLEKLHRRAPGDSYNRLVHGAFRTVEIDKFRNGSFRSVAVHREGPRIDKPWKHGNLVHERLAIKPTSRSFSADPDRRAVRSSVVSARPAVVYSKPTSAATKRGDYKRIDEKSYSPTESRLKSGDRSGSGVAVRTVNRTRSGTAGTSRSERILVERDASGHATIRNQPEQRVYRSDERKDRGRAEGVTSKTDRDRVGSAGTGGDNNRARGTAGGGRVDRDTGGESRSGNTVRTYPSTSSGQRSSRTQTGRSAFSVDIVRSNPDKRADQGKVTGNVSRSFSSSSRSSTTTRSANPVAREKLRTNTNSSRQSSTSRSQSSVRVRTYSIPSSSSRIRSGSTSSSIGRIRSGSVSSSSRPSVRSSTRTSVPSISSRTSSSSRSSSNTVIPRVRR